MCVEILMTSETCSMLMNNIYFIYIILLNLFVIKFYSLFNKMCLIIKF